MIGGNGKSGEINTPTTWKIIPYPYCRYVYFQKNQTLVDGEQYLIPPRIIGAHFVIYSKDEEADRAFFRDILGFKYVDADGGWLIFRLPPAEAAFHPDDAGNRQELYLMCDDLTATMTELRTKGVKCSKIVEARWGSITKIRLPSGAEIGLYQPKHRIP